MSEKDKKESPAEKPISLHGIPFKDVVKILLGTEPMPKETENKRRGEKHDNGS